MIWFAIASLSPAAFLALAALWGGVWALLAILSVIWRWNDFLWPLIVLISDPEAHTLQIGLTAFSGEFNTDYHYILAMTVVLLIPVTLVFVWLQRFITTGIATTGLK